MPSRRKTWRHYAVLAEAAFTLTAARLVVLFSFRRFAPWVLQSRQPSDPTPHPQVERRIQRSIDTASRFLPWESLCLPQAMAAKMMLARRGFPSTIHLGVGQKEGGLHAHAWLEAGGAVITGASARDTVIHLPR